MEKPEIKHNLIRFSEKEREIMRTIGGGNLSEGARICVMWGAHFSNLRLNYGLLGAFNRFLWLFVRVIVGAGNSNQANVIQIHLSIKP